MDFLQRDKNYLYQIKEDPTHYYTGMTANGLQTLVVIYYPSFVTLLFDKDGNFIDVQENPLPASTISLS